MSAATSTDRAAALASLLGRLDSWIGASGYGTDHPWRMAIAEGLADASAPVDPAAAPARHVPGATDMQCAVMLFEQIACAAERVDRHCYYTHGEFDGAEGQTVDSERVELELDFFRSLVCRLGWMADLGSMKLTGRQQVRGDAEQWLLPPSYRQAREGGAA